MTDVQPPCEQLAERALRFGRRRLPRVRADDGDADRAGVEALRVRADDVALHPAAAALEHLAVPVDEEVVADVVPAVRLHVVELDPAHDRRRLLGPVAARAGCVVDDGEAQHRCVARRRPHDLLVGPPAASRDDLRRAREGHLANRDTVPQGCGRTTLARASPGRRFVPRAASSRGPTTGSPPSNRAGCVRERHGPGGPRSPAQPSAMGSTRLTHCACGARRGRCPASARRRDRTAWRS